MRMQYLSSATNENEIVEVYSIFSKDGKMVACISDDDTTFPFKVVKLSKLRPIGMICPKRKAKIAKSRLLNVAKILSDNGIDDGKIPTLINEIGKALLHKEIVEVSSNAIEEPTHQEEKN